MKKILKNRKFRYGGFAAVITVGFIVIIVVLNMLATALYERFTLLVDLTQNKAFTVSEKAEDYLKTIQSDIKIYVLTDRSTYEAYDETYATPLHRLPIMLDQITKINPKITSEYINIVENPSFLSQYSSERLVRSNIIIQSGKRYFVIDASELFEIQLNYVTMQNEVTGDKMEQTLISKIIAADVDNVPVVAFTAGHNEDAEKINAFRQLISSNGYEVRDLDLAVEDIGDDVNYIVIAAPTIDFTAAELKKIDAYLAEKPDEPTIMMVFSASYGGMTNLDAFLAEWGIKAGEGVIRETDSGMHYPGYPTIARAKYAESEYKAMLTGDAPPFIAESRPIEMLFTHQNFIEVTPVIITHSTAQAVNGNDEALGDGNVELNALTISTKLIGSSGKTLRSSVIAVGSIDFFNVTARIPCENDRNIVTLFNVINGREDAFINIQAKSVGLSSMSLSQSQVTSIGLVFFTILVPLLCLAIGITVFIRRRHR